MASGGKRVKVWLVPFGGLPETWSTRVLAGENTVCVAQPLLLLRGERRGRFPAGQRWWRAAVRNRGGELSEKRRWRIP